MTADYNKILLLLYLTFLVVACSEEQTPVGRMPPVLAINETAPDFTFQTLRQSGQGTEKLSEYQGRVIYLDFWASWCKPCLISMPILDQLRAELLSKGFEIIAVNLDQNIVNAEDFLVKYPVDYPVVRAINETIMERYQINGLPTAYIIDREGVIRYAHQGFKAQDIIIIKQQVLSLLE